MKEPKLIRKIGISEIDIKKQKQIIILTVICVVILFLTSSYALLTNFDKSDEVVTIKTGNLEMAINDTSELITLSERVPESDEEGLKNASVIPIIMKNTGTISIGYYEISLISENLETNVSTLDKSYIRYSISEDNESYTEPKSLSDTYLFQGYDLAVGETKTIYLKIWLNEVVPNDIIGKYFYGSISVDLYQKYEKSLDESGANEPVLLDNMIPVYYEATSETEGVWKKADNKNSNQNYQWYDYHNFMWANAVTVKENGSKTREEYINSPLGTEIKMEDITTSWVWIPRYRYTIFNGNNGGVSEQQIYVTFESNTETLGTIKCYDNILTSTSSSSSETCSDLTNGSIINGTSTYTHPAFCFGTKNTDGSCNGLELTGFWAAKFEMSTDDSSDVCTSTSVTETCNTTGLNIQVKPGVVSLRYIIGSNMFVNIRNMELYNNIHGFSQSEKATESSSQTGEITNDNNNFDIHMIKNMEWGAIAYLAQSQYGKNGNSLYTGNYKELYLNNYYNETGYVYKTGYSGGTYNSSSSSSNTYLYNNLTITTEGQGYKGAGASTTGTIYGVYDMSGGGYEYVMGNMVNSSGSFFPKDSGFTGTPLEKYYDKYSYSTSDSSHGRSKLGDGIKEGTKTFGSGTGGWYSDNHYMIRSEYSWFRRGGGATETTKTGLYSGGGSYFASDSTAPSRPILTILP